MQRDKLIYQIHREFYHLRLPAILSCFSLNLIKISLLKIFISYLILSQKISAQCRFSVFLVNMSGNFDKV